MTPDEVQRIAAIRSPILRNLQITYAYSLLAAEITARSGQGANWCTFATWASRQAGRTIRGEDAIGFLQDRLHADRELLHPQQPAPDRLQRVQELAVRVQAVLEEPDRVLAADRAAGLT